MIFKKTISVRIYGQKQKNEVSSSSVLALSEISEIYGNQILDLCLFSQVLHLKGLKKEYMIIFGYSERPLFLLTENNLHDANFHLTLTGSR